ncbi:hypothetical protein AB7813_08180 [Tardiphaga sp. 20_F10_N6_6]|uniref:hypothetical protein n=1 Tax=Tardiphaga sp. 20_F10_N6_6 TaxID=3240788 RepID=UPI003F897C5D
MDDIDKAQDADAVNLADAIARQRAASAASSRLRAIGECRSPKCGELFPANDNRLFCNAACADVFARYHR